MVLKPGELVRRSLENAQISRAVLDLLASMVDVATATNHMQAKSTHIIQVWFFAIFLREFETSFVGG